MPVISAQAVFPWGVMNVPEFIGYMGALGAFVWGIYKFVWEQKLKDTNERLSSQERWRNLQLDENRRLREEIVNENRQLREDYRREIDRLREENQAWRVKIFETEASKLDLIRQINSMEQEINSLRMEIQVLRNQMEVKDGDNRQSAPAE